MHWLYLLSAFASLKLIASTALKPKLIGIPNLQYESTEDGYFDLSKLTGIVVDGSVSNVSDEGGITLIPPTLLEFATTFAADLTAALERDISVSQASNASCNKIFLTLSAAKPFLDAAGRPTSEGYGLHITSDTITINGASPLGAWWASRSILQQLTLRQKLPAGVILDSPGWGTRGLLLDAGRHYYPPQFLVETCAYLSFFKQNVLHLHLSDNVLNLSPPTSISQVYDGYAAFRLNSNDPKLEGLARRANESYTRDQFNFIQRSCAARGVTVIPEIEAPAHALPIVQWKHWLGLSDDMTKLNISHPDTISTIESIWGTFLPWIHSNVVHIGADEYSSTSLSESQVILEYTRLVNELSSTIRELSGKAVRIWGTFPPSRGAAVDKNVSIQHWSFTEDNPISDFIAQGYKVLNSDDMFYMVGKIQVRYGTKVNLTRVFHGAPRSNPWAPHIFDSDIASNNPPRNSSAVLGHIAAFWNDFGPNATTYSEAYYAFRDGLPALADKQWGGTLLEQEYSYVLPILQSQVPGQNLDRRILSASSEIVSYDFTSRELSDPQEAGRTTIKDRSKNGYDATTDCRMEESSLVLDNCVVDTPLQSKGRDYTLAFTVKRTSTAGGPLLTGIDSELYLSPTMTTLLSGGNGYSVNYSFPIGVWTEASLIGAGERTFLKVANGSSYEFLAHVGLYGVQKRMASIAIEAPLFRIGGGEFSGQLRSLTLSGKAD